MFKYAEGTPFIEGDIVKLVNTGAMYSRYSDLAKFWDLKEWDEHARFPSVGGLYLVVRPPVLHPVTSKSLYAVSPLSISGGFLSKEYEFIIGESGIEEAGDTEW